MSHRYSCRRTSEKPPGKMCIRDSYYNKDYLKECGVDTDDLDSRTLENPLTTDEVAEIAEKCTTDDYVGTHIIMDHGEGLPYALEPLYLSAGKDYISEDGKEADGYVNSEEAVNTTAWLADLKMCIRDSSKNLLLGCALAEATAIYGFVIGLLIIIMLG